MSQLNARIAKEFNKLNPVTTFFGMSDLGVDNAIKALVKDGYNINYVKIEYKNHSKKSLSEASEYVNSLLNKELPKIGTSEFVDGCEKLFGGNTK